MNEHPTDAPYLLWKYFYPDKPVRHQCTCPACGRALVNLYKKGELWKCKRCWDATPGEAGTVGQRKKQDQLCWACANAVPARDGSRGCPWSKKFQPVAGWQAQACSVLMQNEAKAKKEPRRVPTHLITECPLFVPDATSG